MGALFLLRDDGSGEAEPELALARAQLARRGFATVRQRALPGWQLLHADPIQGGPAGFLERGDDLVAVAGTMVVDGLMGAAALTRLLDRAELPRLDRSGLGGQFAALVRRGGRTWLFTDHLAGFQLYRDAEARVFSTSFLAAVRALPGATLDPQGVYEFAFNVTPTGDDTVVAELKTLGPETVVELTPSGVRSHAVARSPAPSGGRGSPAERQARNVALLVDLARVQVAQFGDAIHVPLSGGMDSRLVLATLRAAGARPKVYVYGAPTLPDVVIARAIGEAEGFAVDCIDRTTLRNEDPDAFAALVEETFHRTDGLPNFGNLFDGGAGVAAQLARHAPGHLAVSGGAGEVYRDFFRLPDRPLPVKAVVGAFFARFSAADATARFDPGAFLQRIGAKLADAVGAADQRDVVPRAVIEQLYPRVRARALFGRELTIEAGYGSYFLPFLDRHVVDEGAMLPMPLKHAGRFEAALIAAIDPALARHPSTYGHSFVEPPSRRHLLDEWLSRGKPGWLRRYSYALRRMAGGASDDDHGGPIAPELMARVIALDMPHMRAFFDIERIARDRALWYRVACLEYFAATMLSWRSSSAAAPPPAARSPAPAYASG